MTKQQLKMIWKEIDAYEMTEEMKGKSYQEASQMVQDGCFEIYYDGARKFLKDLYNETEEQAEKFSNEQVWNQYKHCIALAVRHPKYAIS